MASRIFFSIFPSLIDGWKKISFAAYLPQIKSCIPIILCSSPPHFILPPSSVAM
jgi:hypothetical protein